MYLFLKYDHLYINGEKNMNIIKIIFSIKNQIKILMIYECIFIKKMLI